MMASVQCLDTNLEQDPDGVKDIFSKFLTNICNGFKDTQDKEEQVIVNNQTLWELFKYAVILYSAGLLAIMLTGWSSHG